MALVPAAQLLVGVRAESVLEEADLVLPIDSFPQSRRIPARSRNGCRMTFKPRHAEAHPRSTNLRFSGRFVDLAEKLLLA